MTSLLRNHELLTFLKERATTHTKDVTLSGMGGEFKGRWHIKNDDYPQFYDHLHDYLFKKQGTPLNLIERPRPNESKPLMIDIDFHYSNQTNMIRRFKEENIFNFTNYYLLPIILYFLFVLPIIPSLMIHYVSPHS